MSFLRSLFARNAPFQSFRPSPSSSHNSYRKPSVNYNLPHYKTRQELIYGTDVCVSALRSQRRSAFHRLYVSDIELEELSPKQRAARSELTTMAKNLKIPILQVDNNMIRTMIGDQRPHNGVALDCAPLDKLPNAIDELLPKLAEISQSPQQHVWVCFDDVQDPQNVGAMLRSSLFFGVSAVILPKKNSAPISPTVAKASAGATEVIPLFECSSLTKFLRLCRIASLDMNQIPRERKSSELTRPPAADWLKIAALSLDSEAKPITEALKSDGNTKLFIIIVGSSHLLVVILSES
jgi:tRNA G18 (ribose-2'-O)-methylase SpoU